MAIARALVKEPRVLLADEPTGNLDEGTRDDLMGLLEELWRDRDLTLIVVTHDSTVARRAQRIGIMRKGRLSIKQDTRRPFRHLPRRHPKQLGGCELRGLDSPGLCAWRRSLDTARSPAAASCGCRAVTRRAAVALRAGIPR